MHGSGSKTVLEKRFGQTPGGAYECFLQSLQISAFQSAGNIVSGPISREWSRDFRDRLIRFHLESGDVNSGRIATRKISLDRLQNYALLYEKIVSIDRIQFAVFNCKL